MGALMRGHSQPMPPMWSSCAWVSTMARMSLRIVSIKAGSGVMISTPGVVWSPKVMPRSTMIHLRALGGPNPYRFRFIPISLEPPSGRKTRSSVIWVFI